MNALTETKWAGFRKTKHAANKMIKKSTKPNLSAATTEALLKSILMNHCQNTTEHFLRKLLKQKLSNPANIKKVMMLVFGLRITSRIYEVRIFEIRLTSGNDYLKRDY